MTQSHTRQHVYAHMNHTGIGLAGLEGVWWLAATQPFHLPSSVKAQLNTIAQATFQFFDAVVDSVSADAGTRQLLHQYVPSSLPALMSSAPVLGVRPDFQLVLTPNEPAARSPEARSLVATELEICPSAHGFAHAMQSGYGLTPDLVQAYAQLLDGRELLFVSTAQWSEFLWEQLAFCAALAGVGARGRVLLSQPIADLARDVAHRRQWRPPMFGIPQEPADWHTDVLGRIRAHGFEPFLQHIWPTAHDLQNSVVFRFGYFDCFEPAVMHRLADWQRHGVTFINPTMIIWDSKVVMAALQLPQVRQRLDAHTLATLDACIPDTRLLTPELIPQLLTEREDWILKFAGFDHGQQAWGGRSVQVGAQLSSTQWEAVVRQYLALPFPCVAQRVVPSATLDIPYWDAAGHEQWLRGGRTRLRSFFLRDHAHAPAQAVGTHLTVVETGLQVSESVEAVQAPVVFSDSI